MDQTVLFVLFLVWMAFGPSPEPTGDPLYDLDNDIDRNGDIGESPGSSENIMDVIRRAGATTFASYASRCPWVVDELSHEPGYTVIVPTNKAFQKLPHDVVEAMNSSSEVAEWYLRYHMGLEVVTRAMMTDNRLLPTAFKPPQTMAEPVQLIRFNVYTIWGPTGREKVVTASGAPIIKADLQASNGIVHIIDRVMFPVPTGSDMAQYLQKEPKYSQLYAGLQTANLTAALSTPDDQPLTLLAPSDAAFAKLSPAQKEALKNTTLLTQVLTYHVVAGSYYSAAIYYSLQLTSLEGSSIYFEKGAGGISAQGQMLGSLDTTVTNGVVHELDGVMFPSALDAIMRGD